MRPGVRRFFAFSAMTGLLASSTLATVMTLHFALDHHDPDGDDAQAATLQALLHGHGHEADTPDHDHSVTAAAAAPPGPGAPSPASIPVAVVADSASAVTSGMSGRTTAGARPRASPLLQLHSILRV